MRYQFLEANNGFEVPSGLEAFRCLILIEREVSADDRNTISRALVDGGCLFAMAWGLDCTLWDDSVDWANLECFDYVNVPDDKFVLTTWHSKDTLEEVLYFAKFCSLTGYNDQELKELLILDLGQGSREANIRQAYDRLEANSPP